MYCTTCGAWVEATARFCYHCGASLGSLPSTAPPMYMPTPVNVIESLYSPQQLVLAGPGRRLAGFLLNLTILIFTLGVGWLIWFIIVAPRGQTPGKQLLGMYVMKRDGTRAGGGYTWLRTIVVRWLLTWAIDFVTVGIYHLVASLWCIWDKEHQCLWDKIAGTLVVYSPHGYFPPTANDLRQAGLGSPAYPHPAGAPAPAMYGPQPRTWGSQQGWGPPVAANGVADQLRELTRLRDERRIDEVEFESRRRELMQQ